MACWITKPVRAAPMSPLLGISATMARQTKPKPMLRHTMAHTVLAGIGPGRCGDTRRSESFHGVWIIDASEDPGKAGGLQSGQKDYQTNWIDDCWGACYACCRHEHPSSPRRSRRSRPARGFDQRRVRRLFRADAFDRRHVCDPWTISTTWTWPGQSWHMPEASRSAWRCSPAAGQGLDQRRGRAAGVAAARRRPANDGDCARTRPRGRHPASDAGSDRAK